MNCSNSSNRSKQSKIWRTHYENNPIQGAKAGVFYILEFRHKTLPFHFLKVGITTNSIKDRYKSKDYREYEYDTLVEYHTTNLISAQIEDNFLEVNQHNRYWLENEMNFAGYTETLNINTKDGIMALEQLHQKTINENKQL